MVQLVDDIQIKRCEIEYMKCFSASIETDTYVRYRDDLLKEMYYHNCTLILQEKSKEDLFNRIEEELLLRKGLGYCIILSFVYITEAMMQKFSIIPEISLNGFYLFDLTSTSFIKEKENCRIAEFNNTSLFEDRLYLEIEQDGERLGTEFCTKRIKRRSDVYLSNNSIDAYICYDNNEPVGCGELFIHKNVAKIENLCVIPDRQRRGYATTLLKYLIEVAQQKGASSIYLVADEGDTAKQLYLKSGFKKIGEQQDFFFEV